jgi:Dyp-type peroxidase family
LESICKVDHNCHCFDVSNAFVVSEYTLKYHSCHEHSVNVGYSGYLDKRARKIVEDRLVREKRKQPGIAFPAATEQDHLLVVRFNISEDILDNLELAKRNVREGLGNLCLLIENALNGNKKIDSLSEDGSIELKSVSDFKLSFTIGFGLGFFEKLRIDKRNRPRRLRAMPQSSTLGDPSPYSLLQTDFILQIGSNEDCLNSWLLQNTTGLTKESKQIVPQQYGQTSTKSLEGPDIPADIYTAIKSWAHITDIHTGFQRIDGKNLLGFNDGISNPFRLSNDVVWITALDEIEKFRDGTYMVFQKIEHDLEKWREMDEEKQELWVGRSKYTGLLLGTLSKEKDRNLALNMHSDNKIIRERAIKEWKNYYSIQKDPQRKFFDDSQTQYRSIQIECPVWSHVRKANPRGADKEARRLIFRRGYLYSEGGYDGKITSGLLFICFQRDIENGFEYIKKNLLNNKNFPIPQKRRFNSTELRQRESQGRLAPVDLQRLNRMKYNGISIDPDSENTGKDGLSGPSELGVYPQGERSITFTLGGGYYFIPPIPNKKISDISEQFFT